jgi:transposase
MRRDALGTRFTNDDFAALFPTRGQPAEAPWRLAFVTIMPDVEEGSDRQAAEAVPGRIDWQDALRWERTDPGFDSTVFSEFRTRLVMGAAEPRLFDAILDRCRARQCLNARGRQRTDATPGLARVRAVKRVACVGDTRRDALNRLAVVAPEWLHAHRQVEWEQRDGRRVEDYRLLTRKEDRHAYAQVIGADGYAWLADIYPSQAPAWAREVPAVETWRRVWVQQFYLESGSVHWRTDADHNRVRHSDDGPRLPTACGETLIPRREISVLGIHGRMRQLGQDRPEGTVAFAGFTWALLARTFIIAWCHTSPGRQTRRCFKPWHINPDLRHNHLRSALIDPRKRV